MTVLIALFLGSPWLRNPKHFVDDRNDSGFGSGCQLSPECFNLNLSLDDPVDDATLFLKDFRNPLSLMPHKQDATVAPQGWRNRKNDLSVRVHAVNATYWDNLVKQNIATKEG